jgi:hypothetical protein
MSQEKESMLELNYRSKNPLAHPIRGDLFGSRQFLMKIQRDEKDSIVDAELIGRVTRLARFRAMADYQYTSHSNSVSASLRKSMEENQCKKVESHKYGKY